MKINSTFRVRQIKPQHICIGDTIRWTKQDDDITTSRVAKVGSKDYGPNCITFYSPNGKVINVYWLNRLERDTIALLQPAPQNEDIQLENFEALQKVIENVEKN